MEHLQKGQGKKLLGSLVVACMGVVAFQVWANLTFNVPVPNPFVRLPIDICTGTRINVRRHDELQQPLMVVGTLSNSTSSTERPPLNHEPINNNNPLIPVDQMQFCEKNNFVHSANKVPAFRTRKNARTYTITPQSFQRHHNRYCETSSELLMAIKLANRSWGLDSSMTDNLTMEEKELLPSYFVPHGCDIPYMNTREYCAAANSFSHIVIQGDSLSRHLHQAMLIAYRGDLIRGSIVPSFPNSSHLHRCHCDAQFSQSHMCRLSDSGIFVNFQPHQIYACSELPYDNQFTQHYSVNRFGDNLTFSYEGVNCSSPNYKGILLYVQGGVHWNWCATPYWRHIWKQVLDHPTIKECAQQKKLTLIRTGYMAQSPFLDRLYPLQTMKMGQLFDKKMEALFRSHRISVPAFRWVPLTLGAPKSDGLHFLTDVYLQQAQQLMILANMLKREGKHQSIGFFKKAT